MIEKEPRTIPDDWQHFILKLSDKIRPIYDSEEVQFEAVSLLGKYLNVDHSFYCAIEPDGDHLWIKKDYVNNTESQAGYYRISDYGPFLLNEYRAGRTVVIQNTAFDTRLSAEERLKYPTVNVKSFVCVPLVKGNKLLSMLSVNQSTPRDWTDVEIRIIQETAERTWEAVERAKAQEELHKSEEKYRTLFNSIDQGFALCELVRDEEGKGIDYYFLELNATFENQTGFKSEVYLNKTMLEAFPTLDKWWIETYSKVVDSKQPISFEKQFDDRFFEIKALPGNGDTFTVLYNDITERNAAEEKLKESENLFRTMADASPVLIWTIDSKGLSVYFNKTFLDFIGVSKSEDISDWKKIIHPDDVQFVFETVNTAIAEHKSYSSLECRLLRADGQWRWVLAQGNPRLGPNNEFLGFVGSSVDFTEHKLAEEKVSKSEKKYRSLIETMDQGFFIMEMVYKNNKPYDYVFIEVNRVFENHTGFKSVAGKTARELFPEIKEKWFKIYENVISTGKSNRFIEGYEVTGRWYEVYAFKIESNNRVAVLFTDITERTQSERKILDSESRFKNLIRDASAAIVVLIGPEMKVEIVNEAYGRLIDLKPEDLLGKPLFSIVPEAEEYYRPLLEKVLKTGEAIHLQDTPYSVLINGNRIEGFVNVVYQPYRGIDGEILGVMAIMQDVTEAVKSRQKLEESEQRFKAAILAVEGIIWTNNAFGEMEGEQTGWAKLTGQTYEEYQGFGWAKALHPDDEISTINAWNNAVIKKSTFEFEHRINTKEAGCRHFSVKAVPVLHENGTIQQWVGVHTDITKEKENALKIKESENRFRTLAESLPQLIWMTNDKGVYEYASSQWMDYSGLDVYNNDNWEKLVHPEDKENLSLTWNNSLSSGEIYNAETRLKNKMGLYRWHLVQGEPIRNEDGNIIKWIGAFTDIENLKEEQKRKDDFLFMASHELKTPLTTIKAYTQIVERILEERGDEKILGMIKKMSKQASHLNSLIADLLDVTKMRKGGLIYQACSLNFNDLVEEIIDDMQKTTVTHEIKNSLNTDLKILGDKNKLSQVLNNLISNAIKYSPDANEIIVNTLTVKDGVQLIIQDFGIGISEEQQQYVFDQFYRVTGENQSTFPGMGIGLYLCTEIVKRAGGKIWVESELEKGSIFYVWLPINLSN